MTDEEQAKNIKQELTSALLVVNAILDEADANGYQVSYTSNKINGEFETKITVMKKL